jgi:hypothetical protein
MASALNPIGVDLFWKIIFHFDLSIIESPKIVSSEEISQTLREKE